MYITRIHGQTIFVQALSHTKGTVLCMMLSGQQFDVFEEINVMQGSRPMSMNQLEMYSCTDTLVYKLSCRISCQGAIQVLCNANGGGGVSNFLEKSVTKV